MNQIRGLALFHIVTVSVLVFSDPAFAECGKGTLGSVICNVSFSSEGIPGLLSGLSYLFGVVLAVMGIWKLRQHVENPSQVPIWDPIKRFLAGAAFFALPMIIEAAVVTVAGALEGHSENGFSGKTSGGGLDTMMVRLIASIWQPLMGLLGGFGYLAGVVLIMIGISRLLKTEQEGAKGPLGIGTVMTFLVGGALIALNRMMGSFSTSMFNTAVVTTKPKLMYTAGMENGVQHVEAVISAVIAFVAIVGWISFLRGFFIIRGVAEGNSQASIMAGMTHLLGGALAVNLGPLLQAVQVTLQITDYGICFSGCGGGGGGSSVPSGSIQA